LNEKCELIYIFRRAFKTMKLLRALIHKLETPIGAAISALIGMITLGTVAYHYLEGWNWISSFYFSVATLTTVGYGDLYPTSDFSRLFTAAYVLIGVAIALTTMGLVTTNYLLKREGKLLEMKERVSAEK